MQDHTPNSARGEVVVVLGGQPRTLRFGMNVLRDYSRLTGHLADAVAKQIIDNFNDTILQLTYCALKRYVPAAELPADFSEDTVGDWLDEMSEEEGGKLADALWQSIRNGNPMTAAMVKQVLLTAKQMQADAPQA